MIIFSVLCWGSSLLIPATGRGAPDLVPRRNVLVSTAGLSVSCAKTHACGGARWSPAGSGLSEHSPCHLCHRWSRPALRRQRRGGHRMFSAIFSISIALGSGLAAWLAAGRIILLPTVIGAVLLGLFAIDIGWSAMGAAATAAYRLLFHLQLLARCSLCLGSRRIGYRGRTLHCADVFGRAGLGRRRPARSRSRGGQRAQCSLHGWQHAHVGGGAESTG